MIPCSLTGLCALFCESFGQMCYVIKISDQRRLIRLLGVVEERFDVGQSFCVEMLVVGCQARAVTSTHD